MKIKITFFIHITGHIPLKKNVLSSLKMFFAPFKSPVNPFSWSNSNPTLTFYHWISRFTWKCQIMEVKLHIDFKWLVFSRSTPDISHLIMCLCAPCKGLGYTCLVSNITINTNVIKNVWEHYFLFMDLFIYFNPDHKHLYVSFSHPLTPQGVYRLRTAIFEMIDSWFVRWWWGARVQGKQTWWKIWTGAGSNFCSE